MTFQLRVFDSFAQTNTVLYSSLLPGCCCSPVLNNKKGSKRRKRPGGQFDQIKNHPHLHENSSQQCCCNGDEFSSLHFCRIYCAHTFVLLPVTYTAEQFQGATFP